MDADNVGAPVTKAQWDFVHQTGDALRRSLRNVSAVFAPSCMAHAVLTRADWQQVTVDGVSVAEALHCWEHQVNRRHQRRRQVMAADQPATAAQHRRRKRKKYLRNKNGKCRKRRGKQVFTILQILFYTGFALAGQQPLSEDCVNRTNVYLSNRLTATVQQDDDRRQQRSVLQLQQRQQQRQQQRRRRNQRRNSCAHRHLERCSWPQCNRSCPKLHDPFTGEEMDFIDLLKSFGLDMASVADALGIDMHTLNNMDHDQLLNLLTQQQQQQSS